MESSGNIPEKVLIEKCVAFDRNYQEMFYRRYADKMFRVCLTYSDNHDDAADILQEGFIKIFRKIHQYNFEGSLEGWVRKVIVNTALENYRKKIKEMEKIKEVSELEEGYEFDMDGLGSQEIIEMVNHLPSKAQVVLKLYAIEGYSHKEIAAQLNISEGTSKSQLNRARKLLRDVLVKHNGE